jgi:hypothetical protein
MHKTRDTGKFSALFRFATFRETPPALTGHFIVSIQWRYSRKISLPAFEGRLFAYFLVVQKVGRRRHKNVIKDKVVSLYKNDNENLFISQILGSFIFQT